MSKAFHRLHQDISIAKLHAYVFELLLFRLLYSYFAIENRFIFVIYFFADADDDTPYCQGQNEMENTR